MSVKKDLKKMISDDENILYEGKPKKSCFVLEAIFNPMLFISIIWAVVDFGIIGISLFAMHASGGGLGEMLLFIPFFALHLMPVWIYLSGVLFTFRKYRHLNYIITDRAVYVSSGVFAKSFNTKPFAELSRVDLHRGIFDQMCGVGDVVLDSTGSSARMTIGDIKEYTEVYNLVKKLQQDIYTDIMYPNDKRPSENHGYKTEYKG